MVSFFYKQDEMLCTVELLSIYNPRGLTKEELEQDIKDFIKECVDRYTIFNGFHCRTAGWIVTFFDNKKKNYGKVGDCYVMVNIDATILFHKEMESQKTYEDIPLEV